MKDKIGLQSFHQQLLITSSCFSSIEYGSSWFSYDNLIKTLQILLPMFHNDFLQHTNECNASDGTINLLLLKKWFKKQL